jgi:hypothetical protein
MVVAACHGDRLLADCIASIAPVFVAQGSGESCKQPCAQHEILFAKHHECLVEQRDEPDVAAGTGKDDPSAVARRRGSELTREAELARDPRSTEK